MKKKPIRTVLMLKTEEYVRKHNLINPDNPIEDITSEVLELVANKHWSEVITTKTIANWKTKIQYFFFNYRMKRRHVRQFMTRKKLPRLKKLYHRPRHYCL
jgi:hypothetical protein